MTTTDARPNREDFVAFSLAAADILLSVADDDMVMHAMGATKSLLKRSVPDIVDKSVLDLFDGSEASFIRCLLRTARQHGRIEPTVIMLGRGGDERLPANLGLSYLPDRRTLYMAVTVLPHLVVESLPQRDVHSGLLQPDSFGRLAAKAGLDAAQGNSAEGLRELRMIRLQGLPSALERLPTPQARRVMSEVGSLLRSQASNGGLASQFDGERFGVVAKVGSGVSAKDLAGQISAALANCGIERTSVKSTAETVTLDLKDVSPTDAAKAMAFAIGEFGKAGGLGISSLSRCLDEVLQSTLGKVNHAKSVIDGKHFTLAYQPIVEILSRDPHHYEALVRFNETPSPFEFITFAERVGLACDMDTAVLEMAFLNMRLHPGAKVGVNISGCSIQKDAFRSRLLRLISAEKAYSENLMIELTESANVDDIAPVAQFIGVLRKKGIEVALDDFGAGANAYNYLRSFDADYVKIDGPFLKAALTEDRQRALVKSVVLLCHELGIQLIGEMIETEQMAEAAASLGIEYGQGYLYGKPQASLVMPTPNLRRKGAVETWQ